MAFTPTLAGYKEALLARPNPLPFTISSTTVVQGKMFDLWATTNPTVGAAPTTAVAPTKATVGARDFQNGGAGKLLIAGANFATNAVGSIMVCDRLSHQGGLSGIVTTAQTTNLPTAALTRYTSGVGVMLGLTIYTAIGSTATTVTASYTNEAGTSGRTTAAVAFGGTGQNTAGRMVLLPLQSGDTGVRSVQSVTVLATTGTAGAFGVTLFKPLYAISVDSSDNYAANPADLISGKGSGGLPEILDDACLFITCMTNAGTMVGNGELILAET